MNIKFEAVCSLPEYCPIKSTRELELIDESLNIPYYGAHVGRFYCKENRLRSLLTADSGKSSDETILQHMINDKYPFIIKHCTVLDSETDDLIGADDYYIQFQDPENKLFLPTVAEGVCRAMNVDSTYLIEYLFRFEDGYSKAIYKEIKTGGMGSINLADVLDGMDAFESEELFDGCEDVAVENGGRTLTLKMVDDVGHVTTWEEIDKSEFMDGLVSIRIVKMDNTIVDDK